MSVNCALVGNCTKKATTCFDLRPFKIQLEDGFM